MSTSVRIDTFPALVAVSTADNPIPVDQMSPTNSQTYDIQVNTARVVVTNDRVIIARDGGTPYVYTPRSVAKSPCATSQGRT